MRLFEYLFHVFGKRCFCLICCPFVVVVVVVLVAMLESGETRCFLNTSLHQVPDNLDFVDSREMKETL